MLLSNPYAIVGQVSQQNEDASLRNDTIVSKAMVVESAEGVDENFLGKVSAHDTLMQDTLSVLAVPAHQVETFWGEDSVEGCADFSAGIKGVLKKDSITGKVYVDKSVWGDRIAGESGPYVLRNDDLFSGAMLLLFVIGLLIAVHANRYFKTSFKHFFERKRQSTIFEEAEDAQMRGRSVLLFQASVAIGFLLFNYFQSDVVHTYDRITTLSLLGLNVALCYACVLLKIFVFNSVNRTLFTREQSRTWSEGFVLVLNCAGLLLMPVALLSLYSQISLTAQLYFVILLAFVCEIVLFYKSFRTFFGNGLGYLHLILYFCALEIAPYLVMWCISTNLNQILIDL